MHCAARWTGSWRGTKRTRFVTEEGQAVQRVASADVGFALDRVDLQGQADREQALATLSEREANTPFDLAHGPLIRGRLVKLGEQEHVLLITMHHIVSDGWSQGVLARELGSLYEAYRAGNADPLPALPIQLRSLAAPLAGGRGTAKAGHVLGTSAGRRPNAAEPADRHHSRTMPAARSKWYSMRN